MSENGRLAWVRCQTRPCVAYVTTGGPAAVRWSVWYDRDQICWRAQRNERLAAAPAGSALRFASMEAAMLWCECAAAHEGT